MRIIIHVVASRSLEDAWGLWGLWGSWATGPWGPPARAVGPQSLAPFQSTRSVRTEMTSKDSEKAQVSAELQQFIAQEQAKAQVRFLRVLLDEFSSRDSRGRTSLLPPSLPVPLTDGFRPSSLVPRPSFVVVLQLQQTISRLTDECWDKCVSSPSTYFSGKENACLDNCAKRFMDTTQFVIKYYNSKNSRSGGFDEFS